MVSVWRLELSLAEEEQTQPVEDQRETEVCHQDLDQQSAELKHQLIKGEFLDH